MNNKVKNKTESSQDELPYFLELKYPYSIHQTHQAYLVWQKVGDKYKILKSRGGSHKENISKNEFLKLKDHHRKLLIADLEERLENEKSCMAFDINRMEESLEHTKIIHKQRLAAMEANLSKIKLA
jgi:hypothetical protein